MVEIKVAEFSGKPIAFETAVKIIKAEQMTSGAIRFYYEVNVVTEEEAAETLKASESPVKFKTVDFGEDQKKAERGSKKEK